MSEVHIVDAQDDSLEQPVHQIMEAVGQKDWRGMKVLIKPNILSASAPAEHITTSPALVSAVVRYLKANCAGQILVGDNSGSGNSLQAAKKTGIFDASEGHYILIEERSSPLRLQSLGITVEIATVVNEVDIVINLPKFKTHTRTFLTGAIKNMFGMVIGRDKQKIHRQAPIVRDFVRAVVEVYAHRIPEINIMDGIVAMQGNGPACDDLRPLGVLLASTSGPALDSVMASMMGVAPSQIPLLIAAHDMELGEIEPDRLSVKGNFRVIPDFKMPTTFSDPNFKNSTLPLFNKKRSDTVLLSTKKCTQCGDCATHCPVSAITMSPYPGIDFSACINCHCCMELCPQGAWKLDG